MTINNIRLVLKTKKVWHQSDPERIQVRPVKSGTREAVGVAHLHFFKYARFSEVDFVSLVSFQLTDKLVKVHGNSLWYLESNYPIEWIAYSYLERNKVGKNNSIIRVRRPVDNWLYIESKSTVIHWKSVHEIRFLIGTVKRCLLNSLSKGLFNLRIYVGRWPTIVTEWKIVMHVRFDDEGDMLANEPLVSISVADNLRQLRWYPENFAIAELNVREVSKGTLVRE